MTKKSDDMPPQPVMSDAHKGATPKAVAYVTEVIVVFGFRKTVLAMGILALSSRATSLERSLALSHVKMAETEIAKRLSRNANINRHPLGGI